MKAGLAVLIGLLYRGIVDESGAVLRIKGSAVTV